MLHEGRVANNLENDMRYLSLVLALLCASFLLPSMAIGNDAKAKYSEGVMIGTWTGSWINVPEGGCETIQGREVCSDKKTARIRMSPAGTVEIQTTNKWSGRISGITTSDTVTLSSNNDAKVKGDGGTVVLGNGSTTTVTNTGPPNSSITVIFPGGGTASVHGGGAGTTFNT